MSDRLDLDTAWMDAAACRDVPVDVFFDHDQRGFAQARLMCAGCPVVAECLRDALEEPGQQYGFRGGKTQEERRRMLHVPGPLPPINHGTNGGYQAHLKRGSVPCDECRRGHADDKRRRRAERGAA